MGEGEARGRPPPLDDAKIAAIAAIALVQGMTLATSNTRHLAPLCPTVDPARHDPARAGSEAGPAPKPNEPAESGNPKKPSH
jgi:hypothetical protein